MKKIILLSYLFLKKQNIFWLYFLYLIFILASSIVFCVIYSNYYTIVDGNNNLILKNIDFGHGELIHNFYYHNHLSQKFNGIDFYLKKTLALPLIIYMLAKISLNFIFIISLKNIIMYSLYFWVCYFCYKTLKKNFLIFLLLLVVPIVVPYNFQVSLNFNYEDNLIALILPIIYILLINKKSFLNYVIISFFIFFAYFCKTSMFFIVLITPILIVLLEKKSYLKLIPSFAAILAISIWGFYGINKTGKFPIGPSGSSFNSFVMAFSFNQDFHKYYPIYSTDLINVKKPKQNINNEWDFYTYYKKKNSTYLENNLGRFVKDFLIKLRFIFLNIHEDGSLEIISKNKIKIDNIFNKVIINSSLITFIFFAYKFLRSGKINFNIFQTEYLKINLYFIILFILSIFPHLIVWATSKHLVGITNVGLIYLIFKNEIIINNFLKNLTGNK